MYRAEQITDAIYVYKKTNLANMIHDNCSHIKSEEKNQLFRLSTSFEDSINGTLGN